MNDKNFIAIGKIIIETPGYAWNIPYSHFIVNKTASGLYEATNLEFILDSAGNSVKESVQTLAKLTLSYVMDILVNRNGHNELKELVDSTVMEDYWREYRKMEVELSRTKRDLSHNMERLFITAIKETMDENLKKLLHEKASDIADAVFEVLRDRIPNSLSVSVELQNIDEAA